MRESSNERDALERAELPWGAGSPSACASLGLHLATRASPRPPGRAFRDRDRVLEAHARGALRLGDTIRVGGRTTTCGRYLVAECLPPGFRGMADAPWDAERGAREIARIGRELHVELAARAVMALEQLGRFVADRSGFSLALEDFEAPPGTGAVIAEAYLEVAQVTREYERGETTDGERYNRVVDVWARTAERARLEARKRAPDPDPLAACAASYPGTPRPDVVRAIHGPIAKPSGEVMEGLIGSLIGGLSTIEYFSTCAVARRGVCEAAARDREADALFHDLFAVLGGIAIVASDCGTARGTRVRASEHADDAGSWLAHRIEGRVASQDVVGHTGEVLAVAGALITPAIARRIEAAQVVSVMLRDVRTCEARGGVCARCFGLAPEDAIWPSIGDEVGARAAEAISAAVRRLPRDRMFHIC
jgi:DNA-directed RNA polymerase subunit beta'